MPEVEMTCYNCIHHALCKYEPNWIAFPIKDDAASDLWFKEVPRVVAHCCSHFKVKEKING